MGSTRRAPTTMRRDENHEGPAPHAIRWVTIAALLVIAASSSRAQIVDTLDAGVPGERGTEYGLSLAIGAEGGNNDTFEADLAGSIGWRGELNRLRLMSEYDFKRADGNDTSDDSMAHLRHNYRLSESWSTLAFTQWQRNPFQRLRRRVLVGAGLRWDAIRTENVRLAFGSAPMLEYETLSGEDEDERSTVRVSNFVDWAWTLENGTQLSARIFLQPRASDLEDVRSSGAAEIAAPLGGGFSLALTGSIEVDTDAPDDVEEVDWEIATALRFRRR